ncbi:MAG TPA: c-type cytochrome [Acetobacteraceae bacterium]
MMRLLPALSLGAYAAQAQPAAVQSVGTHDPMDSRVLACAPCHGTKGQGAAGQGSLGQVAANNIFPRLSGKPAGYLFNQLVAFREGRRRYPPMNYLLEFQTDAYLHAMADHFAAQRSPLPPAAVSVASRDVLAQGQSLVTAGDTARGIPACAACHGPDFNGMEPAIPGLLGLRPDYISAQLGAWRYGTRTAAAPDCMQAVAGRLTEADVTAVAAWLSALPDPANPDPAPQGSLPMPLACGSEPQ